jgi:hypothetical protein
MIPGRMLHRIAARTCCATTLERIVEPAIADLQKEYAEAAAAGRVKYVWVLARGYLAIIEVIGMCALDLPVASDADRRAIARTIAFAVALTTMFTAFLMLPPMTVVDGSISEVFLVGLIPQAVPLAIPLGLTFGIAFGMARRSEPTRTITKVILMCAFIGSLVSFATMGWIMPAANQAWRESVARTRGITGQLLKGPSEMTLSELKRAEAIASAGDVRQADAYAWSFHLRFALSGASVVLACFLLATAGTSAAARGFISLGACLAYWALIYTGEWLAVYHAIVPAIAGAWLPNLILTAFAILIACSRPTAFDAKPQSRPENL